MIVSYYQAIYKDLKSMATLTLTGVSNATGIKRRTLYNMIKDGRFPVEPIKGTNPRLWNEDDVKKWVKNDNN